MRAPLDASAERLAGRIRCASCGAATTDPWPSEEELGAAYGDLVPARAREALRFGRATRSSAAPAACSPRRIDAIAPPGPVLDVGAGDGTLVDALRDRGREAIGLERNAAREDFRDQPLEEIEAADLGGGRLLALARAPARARRRDPRGGAAALARAA